MLVSAARPRWAVRTRIVSHCEGVPLNKVKRRESRTGRISPSVATRLTELARLITDPGVQGALARMQKRRTHQQAEQLLADQAGAGAPAAPPLTITWSEPTYSSKTKRTTLIGTLTLSADESPWEVTIRVEATPTTLANVVRRLYTDPGTIVLRMGNQMLIGLAQAARVGPRVTRAGTLKEIKETSAAVYRFLGHTGSGQETPPAAVIAAIRNAERAFTKRVPGWQHNANHERRTLFTAFLVHRAFHREWKMLALKDPLSEPQNTPNSFFKRYVQPGQRPLEESLRKADTSVGAFARPSVPG